MMKRIAALMMALMMLCGVALATEPDATTSASTVDHYAATALTGDELMNAINSFSGTYLVGTTNPDGTANVAYFIFSIVEHEGVRYLQLGLAENQSKANLLANPKGVAVYAANPVEGAMPYSVSGARIWFDAIEDEALIETLRTNYAYPTTLFFNIVEVRPLG